MKTRGELGRWSVVALYAIGMAWVEAAVVLYLRTITGQLDPHQPHPPTLPAGLVGAEVIREAATLVMLATVGCLAGRTWRSRMAYALVAFGIWDIGYYVFLVPLTGWPRTLLDWDVLFLIPLPWWGPVLAPVLIASLMIVGGSLVAWGDAPERPLWPAAWTVGANAIGGLLALYVFMTDAIRVAPRGVEALREMLPTEFQWPLFLVALALMAVPVLDLARRSVRRRADDRALVASAQPGFMPTGDCERPPK